MPLRSLWKTSLLYFKSLFSNVKCHLPYWINHGVWIISPWWVLGNGAKNWYALPVIVYMNTYICISRYMTNSCIIHVVAEISYQLADISHCLHFEFFFTLELNPSYAMEIANMARICICLVDNSLVKETIWHAFNLL